MNKPTKRDYTRPRPRKGAPRRGVCGAPAQLSAPPAQRRPAPRIPRAAESRLGPARPKAPRDSTSQRGACQSRPRPRKGAFPQDSRGGDMLSHTRPRPRKGAPSFGTINASVAGSAPPAQRRPSRHPLIEAVGTLGPARAKAPPFIQDAYKHRHSRPRPRKGAPLPAFRERRNRGSAPPAQRRPAIAHRSEALVSLGPARPKASRQPAARCGLSGARPRPRKGAPLPAFRERRNRGSAPPAQRRPAIAHRRAPLCASPLSTAVPGGRSATIAATSSSCRSARMLAMQPSPAAPCCCPSLRSPPNDCQHWPSPPPPPPNPCAPPPPRSRPRAHRASPPAHARRRQRGMLGARPVPSPWRPAVGGATGGDARLGRPGRRAGAAHPFASRR